MRDYFFDFHLHSCLSPCGDDDMTPANLAAMCALAGYDAVALTDHNTVGNCAAFCAAARRHGLVALPGMELTTLEEVHLICLFPELSSAQAFGAVVRQTLPPVPNDPDVFGRQLLMDDGDGILGEETALLAGASGIGVYDAAALAARYGGIAYPAHIDRPSFSLLSNLGFWDPAMGFSLAEISPNCPPELFSRPDLKGVRLITGCDAHCLSQIPDPVQAVTLSELNADALLHSLTF